MAVGDAAAGKVHRAFENGGAREGELADLRQRCRKRQHGSWRAGGHVGGREPYETEQWPLAMPPPGECTVNLRMPAMANGRSTERKGDGNGGVREGNLVDVR